MATDKNRKSESDGNAATEPSAQPVSDTDGNASAKEKKRPAHTIGPVAVDKNTNVQVAIWDRQITLPDKREITVYSCSIQCSYFDQQAGEWVNTPFFRGAALPIVSWAVLKAFEWMLEAQNASHS